MQGLKYLLKHMHILFRRFAKHYRPGHIMVALHKLLIELTSLILLLTTNSVDSTWNDAEGGTIPIPQDKLSWPQVRR
jgi:hypothetical protein